MVVWKAVSMELHSVEKRAVVTAEWSAKMSVVWMDGAWAGMKGIMKADQWAEHWVVH
jgi:hypothetical protein